MDDSAHLGRSMPPLRDTSALLGRITRRLAARHRASFSRETVERYVTECADLLTVQARVSTHLPTLVERFADHRLGALARGAGISPEHGDALEARIEQLIRELLPAESQRT
ncbi:three-helix bundle dimerization domain-containing protein [Streptomyces sp. NPDC057271]|uniref:three-helix bundle dimerization domain-containing protein n=1 Tax=unclassified Streptomyces TaxID=2593676 RepID=UPI003636DBB7